MTNRRERKTHTFTMAMPDMVWAGVGAAFALTVFFLLGVFVGRGCVVVEVEPEPISIPDQLSETEPVLEIEVLKPEDLAYQDQLETTGESEAAVALEESADAMTKTTVQPDKATIAQADAPKSDSPDALPAPEPGQAVFDYVYQAAAFRNEAAAHVLADKLSERNLEAKVVVGKSASATWYRVQLPFTGTPGQTRSLRELVQDVTGENPIMVSKKVAD